MTLASCKLLIRTIPCVRFLPGQEPKRSIESVEELAGMGLSEADLTLQQRVLLMREAGVREMITELASPTKRIFLIIFEWYYTNSLSRFLDFSQNDKEPLYQSKRVHRVVRCQLAVFKDLKGSADGASGAWMTQLKPVIDAFITKQEHRDALRAVDTRRCVRILFTAAHDDLYVRSRGYWSPLALIHGVLDEKGHAVRTAEELVKLAGPQGPMVGFPQLLAYDPAKGKPSSAEAKGRLHEGIGTTEIINAVKDPRYGGIALYWLQDLWSMIVKLKGMPTATILRDVPELKPLYEFLLPFAKASPWTNVRLLRHTPPMSSVLKGTCDTAWLAEPWTLCVCVLWPLGRAAHEEPRDSSRK